MTKNKVAEVATKIVKLLQPLKSEERRRAVDAALTMVGEEKSTESAPNPEAAKQLKQDGKKPRKEPK
jgi:hypothetical protein